MKYQNNSLFIEAFAVSHSFKYSLDIVTYSVSASSNFFFFTEDMWYIAPSYLKQLKRIWRMMDRSDMNENVSVIKLWGFCWCKKHTDPLHLRIKNNTT